MLVKELEAKRKKISLEKEGCVKNDKNKLKKMLKRRVYAKEFFDIFQEKKLFAEDVDSLLYKKYYNCGMDRSLTFVHFITARRKINNCDGREAVTLGELQDVQELR
ncbi:hypothetical protein Tco_0413574 [Tanacetum coccineum]